MPPLETAGSLALMLAGPPTLLWLISLVERRRTRRRSSSRICRSFKKSSLDKPFAAADHGRVELLLTLHS